MGSEVLFTVGMQPEAFEEAKCVAIDISLVLADPPHVGRPAGAVPAPREPRSQHEDQKAGGVLHIGTPKQVPISIGHPLDVFDNGDQSFTELADCTAPSLSKGTS